MLWNTCPSGVVDGGSNVADGFAAFAACWASVHLRLQGGCLLRVLRGELRERVGVLRLQRRVALECRDRVGGLVLLLEGGRERAPVGRVARIGVRLLLKVRDVRAARAARAEEVLQRIADTRSAGADAEQRERGRECDCQPDVDPLGVVSQAREEQLVLPLGRLLAARRLRRRCYRCCGASIRPRAALAVLRTSCHSLSPVRYLVLPSTTVSSTRSGEPPNTTAAAGSSTGW